MNLKPGAMCGQYTIVQEIAHGGMGVVYEAHNSQGEKRAIKMLKAVRLKDDIVERFEREIQVLSYLDSAHVVRFYEAGVHDSGSLWVALEYLAGRTLQEITKEHAGKLSIERVIRWGRQIAQGVHEAHKLSVIHRDLKPANIAIVEGDIAKVFDFGIAKYRNWGVRPTALGVAMGTLKYMAPEQFGGNSEHINEACDVYALGVILFELFSGQHPILNSAERLDMVATIFKTLTIDAPKLSDLIPDFPPRLSEIIDKTLAKKPEDRFSNMMELSDALAAVLRVMADKKRQASLAPLDKAPTDEYDTTRLREPTVAGMHSDSIEMPAVFDRPAEIVTSTVPLMQAIDNEDVSPYPDGNLLSQEPVQLPKHPDRLLMVVGPESGLGHEFPLDQNSLSFGGFCNVGRDESCNISINHASISRFHAKLKPMGNSRWMVIDSHSSNGIFINGIQCCQGIIKSGDAIEFGDVRFRLIPSGTHVQPKIQKGKRIKLPKVPSTEVPSYIKKTKEQKKITKKNKNISLRALIIFTMAAFAIGFSAYILVANNFV